MVSDSQKHGSSKLLKLELYYFLALSVASIWTLILFKSVPFFLAGEIYTSEKNGSDENGNGTESKPFKTILQAMRHAGKEPFPVIYVDGKEEGMVSNANLLIGLDTLASSSDNGFFRLHCWCTHILQLKTFQ